MAKVDGCKSPQFCKLVKYPKNKYICIQLFLYGVENLEPKREKVTRVCVGKISIPIGVIWRYACIAATIFEFWVGKASPKFKIVAAMNQ